MIWIMNVFFCCALIAIGVLFGAVEYPELSLDNIPKLSGVLGVFVALFVFFGTQYLVDKRDRQRLKREKVEHLYAAIEDYRVVVFDFINLSFKADAANILTIQRHNQEVFNALNKIEMYMNLYFQTQNFERLVHDEYRNGAFVRCFKRLQEQHRLGPKDHYTLGDEHTEVFKGISKEVKMMKETTIELININNKPVRLGFIGL